MSDVGRELSRFQEALPTTRVGRALRRKVVGAQGKFDCGIRVVEGSVPSRGARWKHRRSHVEGDRLAFVPADAPAILGSAIAGDRHLYPDPHVDDL